MTGLLLAGAIVGLGVFLLIGAVRAPATRGAAAPAALARWDAARRRHEPPRPGALPAPGPAQPSARFAPTRRAARLGPALHRRLEDAGVRLPGRLLRDLALLEQPVENHLSHSVLGAVVGLMGALSLSLLVAAQLGTAPPLWVAVLGAGVGASVPSLQVFSRAERRRRDLRHVVGSFLDLVAMNLAGGRGVPEALASAASVTDGWAMVRLRRALENARLQGITPWSALGRLGEQTGLRELADLEAALDLVADDGAKVRESLAARAAGLRRRELADAEGRAQARSQSMLLAQLLLAAGFLIFLMYPAVVRVLDR